MDWNQVFGWLNFFTFFLAFYWLKAVVLSRIQDDRRASFYYGLLVLAALAVIYRLYVNWASPFQNILSKLIGDPVALLFVPTVFFFYDLKWRREWSQRALLGRWLAEVVILVPLWATVWGVFQILLRWIWI